MAVIALVCLYDHRALGLRVISNALKAAGHQVMVIHFRLPAVGHAPEYQAAPSHYEAIHTSDQTENFAIRRYNYDVSPWTEGELGQLTRLLEEYGPQIIGITTRSAYAGFLPQLARTLKSVPGAITVAGGFGATFDVEGHCRMFDYVCIGEGEQTMLRMAERADLGQGCRDIGNLAYLDGERVVRNPLIPPTGEDFLYNNAMTSVNHVVIEHGEVLDADVLLRQTGMPHADSAAYHTMAGLGCLNNCAYCCAGRMVELYRDVSRLPKRRMRPVGNVLAELAFAKGYGYKTFTFLDSFFVASTEYLREFFTSYKREIGLPFFAQFYPSQVLSHPELLDMAVDAGLNFTVIGIQSGSDRINRDIFNRPMPSAQVLELAELFGRHPHLCFQYHIITHNPFLDDSDHEQTLKLIARLPKDQAELVLLRLRPFPGTDIAAQMAALPRGPRHDEALQHKETMLYLLRYHLDDREYASLVESDPRHDFASLRRVFVERVIRGGKIRPLFGRGSVPLQGVDTRLYQLRRDSFVGEYAAALDAWLLVPGAANLRALDALFAQNAPAEAVPLAAGIDFSGAILGFGWGIAEVNVHGQKWRWIGPAGESVLYVRAVDAGQATLWTLIHTAVGDALFALRVDIDGEPAGEQRIERVGDEFYHRCVLPGPCKTGVWELRYRLEGGEEAKNPARQLVALAVAAHEPSGRL